MAAAAMTAETWTALLVAGVVSMITNLGAIALKRTASIDSPTRDDKMADEWQQIAVEQRRELHDCREEKQQLQDAVASLNRRVDAQDRMIADIRSELNQWRDGRRVPDGYRLQRLEPPHP